MTLLLPGCVMGQPKPREEINEFDLTLLAGWLTPNNLFFVRDHFPVPSASAYEWKLSVAGTVAAPYEISHDDLTTRQPRKSLPVTIECAENPVGAGLVSHAEWGGVSLRQLLEKAQPRAEARFVRLAGADGFTRTIPLAKAMHPDTLVAWTMNGEKLQPAHGFPLRAVIPGWYGMDSVKWLKSIEATEREDASQGYRRQMRSLLAGLQMGDPVTAINVKSVFSRPADGAILVGRKFVLRGAAWAGENRVQSVDISTSGGESWRPARFSAVGPGSPQPYAWVHWEYEWRIPGPGEYKLAVRARDDQGREQPAERPYGRADGYEWNSPQTIRVLVR